MEGVNSVKSGDKNCSTLDGGFNRDIKAFLRKFVDSDVLKEKLANWLEDITRGDVKWNFDAPFELVDLQKFDYALEGVPFEQLIRMPCSVYESTSSSVDGTAYLALEDFLHASVSGLWKAFWDPESKLLPFYVSSIHGKNLRFYQAEEAISNGKLEKLRASAIMVKNQRHLRGKWDDIVELTLILPDDGTFHSVNGDFSPPVSVINEAVFFAVRVLLARSISRSDIHLGSKSVFVLLVASKYAAAVRVEGDLDMLEISLNCVYESVAAWVKNHSRISISHFDQIWNKFGNANWGDIGTVQALYSTYHSLMQYAGLPKYTIDDLAADHLSRLQERRNQRQLENTLVLKLQHHAPASEIIEVKEESFEVCSSKPLTLDIGSNLLIEDSECESSYCVDEMLNEGEMVYYIASSVDDPRKTFFLYVGSNPSQLETSWEDMRLWYQVQRQTKVLATMAQKGVSSKHLPQVAVSGRIVHSSHRRKQTAGDPWYGTPVLLTTPVGVSVASLVRSGSFGANQAIRCCHDCLSSLSLSASAGIRHGDIRPENIICITSITPQPYFVLTGWGHAVLDDRDHHTVLNLLFSSTSTLQQGKLCSASDAESLVYVLYFSYGGDVPALDSVEGALKWRETAWSKRLIQQKLGDISAVLKAFADYVDSLCGTPYPVDYGIWLTRLRRQLTEGDGGSQPK